MTEYVAYTYALAMTGPAWWWNNMFHTPPTLPHTLSHMMSDFTRLF